MRLIILLSLLCGMASASDCIQINGRYVTAANLSGLLPAFRALPADTILGYTPSPGLRRFWSADQLSGMLTRHGAPAATPADRPGAGICIERPSRAYSAEEVTQALRAALPPDAKFELVEYCRLPMPAGNLSFDLKSLAKPGKVPAQTVVLWRGRVHYEEHRSTPFWASVRVSVPQEGYYAASDLPAGHVLTRSDLVHEARLASPFDPKPDRDANNLIGLRCRRPIPAGSPLRSQLLSSPPEVARGEILQVTVESGAAQITFPGRATASGRTGEMILVVNAETGKHLKAVIEGPGRASAQVTNSNVDKIPPHAGALAGNAGRPVVVRGTKTQEAGNEHFGQIPPGR